jgi:penicillin G amidase
VEKVNPENPRQVLYQGRWEEMRVVEEMIPVRGEDPIPVRFLLTRHGPLITEPDSGREAVSVRWAFAESPLPVHSVYLLNKATNREEIVEALRGWVQPGQNFVFATSEGEIGYWLCAAVPIRSKGDGLLPMPGWTGEYAWEGFIPFEERPHLLNPEAGFIATANHDVTRPEEAVFISRYWEPSDRISRIDHMLKGKGFFSVEDFKEMQQDLFSPLAEELTPLMIRVLKERFSGEEAREAERILSAWDRTMGPDSRGACLFEVAFRFLTENIFRDELGEELFVGYLKTVSFPVRALRGMIRKGSSPWFEGVTTPEKESMEDLVSRSLSQTFSYLGEALGKEMSGWTWGRVHTLSFEHALGNRKPLDRVFNLGPFPVGGSHLTVNKKQYPYEKPFHANHGVAQRMIVDLSSRDHALHVLSTGESGHLKSPHYQDQLSLYLGGEYRHVPISPEEVERQSEHILILRPK